MKCVKGKVLRKKLNIELKSSNRPMMLSVALLEMLKVAVWTIHTNTYSSSKNVWNLIEININFSIEHDTQSQRTFKSLKPKTL